MVKSTEIIQHEPLCEELENLVLALLGQPCLSRDVYFDLMQIYLEDLGCKRFYKVVCKSPVFVLQRAGELRGIAEPG